MNAIIPLVIEGVAVGIVIGSVVIAIAIWKDWIPNFLNKDAFTDNEKE